MHTFAYIGLPIRRFIMNWRNLRLLTLSMVYARRITISRLYTSMFQFGRKGYKNFDDHRIITGTCARVVVRTTTSTGDSWDSNKSSTFPQLNRSYTKMLFYVFPEKRGVGESQKVTHLLHTVVGLLQVVTDILHHMFGDPFVGRLS